MNKPFLPPSREDIAIRALELKRDPLAGELIALEPRMVFDGAGLAVATDAAKQASDTSDAAKTDTSKTTADAAAELAKNIAAAAMPAPSAPAPQEVVFIDSRVSDIDAFKKSAGDNRLVVVVDAQEDGITKITDTLKGLHDISAVHIVGHGVAGFFELGKDWIGVDAIRSHDVDISAWAQSLAVGADILLYGCDVAKGTDGETLVTTLAQETGRDVAASKDAVGLTNHGQDWSLEKSTGTIEAKVIAPESYARELAPTAEVSFSNYADNQQPSTYINATLVRGVANSTTNWTNDTTPSFTITAASASTSGAVAGATARLYVDTGTGGTSNWVLAGSSIVAANRTLTVTVGTFVAADSGVANKITALSNGAVKMQVRQTGPNAGDTESPGLDANSNFIVNIRTTAPPAAQQSQLSMNSAAVDPNVTYEVTSARAPATFTLTAAQQAATKDIGWFLYKMRVDSSGQPITSTFGQVSANSSYTASSVVFWVMGNTDFVDTDPSAGIEATETYYYYVADGAGNFLDGNGQVSTSAVPTTLSNTKITVHLVNLAPVTVGSLVDDVGSVQGNLSPTTGIVTDDPTLTVTGSGYVSGTRVLTTISRFPTTGNAITVFRSFLDPTSSGFSVDGSGNYSYSIPSSLNLVDGLYQVQMTVYKDSVVSGQTITYNSQAASYNFNLLRTAPDFVVADKFGPVQTNSFSGTTLVDALTVSGNIPSAAGSTISLDVTVTDIALSRNGSSLVETPSTPVTKTYSVTVRADRTWDFALPSNDLGTGLKTVSVVATDPNGKSSTLAAPLRVYLTGAWTPGGLGQSGLSFWYDPMLSGGVTKDASNNVSSLNDLSGNGLNATQATAANQPIFVTDSSGRSYLAYTSSRTATTVNGNPVYSINTAQADYLTLPVSLTPRTLVYVGQYATADNSLAVAQPASSTTPFNNAANGAGAANNGFYGSGVPGFSYTPTVQASQANVGFATLPTVSNPWLTGILSNPWVSGGFVATTAYVDGLSLTGPSLNIPQIVGFQSIGARFSGQIGAIVGYSRALSSAEARVLSNAESQQYSVPLGTGVTDLFVVAAASGATAIEIADKQKLYSNDVGGILKSGTSSLESAGNGGLIITNKTFFGSGDASIMFGNNGKSSSFGPTVVADVVNPGITRFERFWAVDVNGGTAGGKVDVAFDVASLAAQAGESFDTFAQRFNGRSGMSLAWRANESDPWSVIGTSDSDVVLSGGKVTFSDVTVGAGALQDGFVTLLDGPTIKAITRTNVTVGATDTTATFRVSVSENVTGLTTSSFKILAGDLISAPSVTSFSSSQTDGAGNFWVDVTVSYKNGSGYVGLDYDFTKVTGVDTGSANAGNVMVKTAYARTDAVGLVDSDAPSLNMKLDKTVLGKPSSSIGTADVSITLIEAGSGLAANDFAILDVNNNDVTSNFLLTAKGTNPSGTTLGTVYSFTLAQKTGGAPDGKYKLALKPSATAWQDAAGNSATADATKNMVLQQEFSIDTTPPTVASITRIDASGNAVSAATKADVLYFKVTFSESMVASSITASDFEAWGRNPFVSTSFSKLASTVVVTKVSSDGNSIILRVMDSGGTVLTGYNGDVKIALKASGLAATDLIGNVLNATIPDTATVEAYTVDNNPPYGATLSTASGTLTYVTPAVTYIRQTSWRIDTLDPVYGFGAGDTPQISLDGGRTYSDLFAVRQNNGVYQYFWNFKDGDVFEKNTIVLRVTDAAGNQTVSAPIPTKFIVDVTKPTVPVITGFTDDVGSSQGNFTTSNVTTDDAKPTFYGTAEAGSTVYLQYNIVNANGTLGPRVDLGSVTLGVTQTNWSFTPTSNMPSVKYSVVTYARDAAYNASQDSAPFVITIDNRPAAPTFTLNSDTGSFNNDFITQTSKFNVSGVASGNTWAWSPDGGKTWSGYSASTVTSFDTNTINGTFAIGQLQLKQKNSLGDESPVFSNAAVITIDKTPPNVTALSFQMSQLIGKTMFLSPDYKGLGILNPEANAIIEYSLDSGKTWQVSPGTNGLVTVLPGGPGTRYEAGQLQVRLTDLAGNVSSLMTLPFAVEVGTPPTAPSMTLPSDTGWSSTDGITKNKTVTVSGLSSNAAWYYSLDGGSTFTQGSGTSFDLDGNATYAAGQIQVGQGNMFGQSPVVSSTIAITTDTTAPVLTSITASPGAIGGSQSSRVTFTFSENIAGLDTSDFTVSGGALSDFQQSIVDPKIWTATYSPTGFVGTASISFASNGRFTDVAGNDGTSSAAPASVLVSNTSAEISIALTSKTGNIGNYLNKDDTVTATVTFSEPVKIDTSAGKPQLTFKIGNNLRTVTYAGTIDPAASLTSLTFTYTIADGDNDADGISFDAKAFVRNGAIIKNNFGNVSNSASSAVVDDGRYIVDTVIVKPSFALTNDAGTAGDGISNNGSMSVSGLEAGAAWQYSLNGGVSWVDGNGSTFPLAEGTYEAGKILVKQVDRAGNMATSDSNASAITIDLTISKPAFSLTTDTGSSNNDGISKVGNVAVSNIEAGASWQYSTDGGSSWSHGTGSSFTLASGIYDPGKILVKQTDTAGNVGTSDANASAITIDQTIATPTFALTNDAGPSNSDGVSNDGRVSVSNLEAGADWQYSIDGGTNWIDGVGSSFTLAPGSYAMNAVKVRQTDKAGNFAMSDGNGTVILIDKKINTPSFALTNDTGQFNSDGISSDGRVSVFGLETSANWAYSTDGGNSWNDGSGTSFTLAEGTYAIGAVKVQQTDKAGNVGTSDANAAAITIDQTIATPKLTLTNDTGASNSDGISSDGRVTVSGLEAGASWQYSTDGGNNWVDGTGSSFTLGAGTYTVQVRQTDKAGNVATSESDITIDQKIAKPTFALTNDTGFSNSDGISADGRVTVSGLEAGASWQYSIDGGVNWIDGTGSSFTLDEGSYAVGKVKVQQTDKAGNNAVSDANTVGIRISGAVATPAFALTTDTGTAGDGISSVGDVSVSGLVAGNTWQYSFDGGSNWIDGIGTSFTLTAGTYAAGKIFVKQIDAAGNYSTSSGNPASIIIDQTIDKPTFALTNDTGVLNSDGISSDGRVTVSNLEAGATWQYSTDAGGTWTNGSGSSFTLSARSYASGAILVKQTDVAGNVKISDGNPSEIKIDQSVATPTFVLTTDTATAGDGISNVGTITVSNLEAGGRWQYTIDNGASWVDGAGSAFTLVEGTYAANAIKVRQTDKAGNESTSSGNPAAIRIDQTVERPTFVLTNDTGYSNSDGLTNDLRVTVSNLEAGGSWQYSTDKGATWTNGSGSAFTLSARNYESGTIKVKQTDLAGNSAISDSNATAITFDQTVATPTFVLAHDTGASGDGISKDGRVTVSGLEDGARWQYSIDGGTNWVDGIGSSFTLAEGQYEIGVIKVKQIDLAGNVATSLANPATITIDQSVDAPSFTLQSDTGSSNSDGISRDGIVTVSGLETGATWQFTTDGGQSWVNGSGTSFRLAEGTYDADAIMVRQTDKADNLATSVSNASAIKIDRTVAKPTFALTTDTGTAGDGITNKGSITVSGLEDGAVWQYSIDDGTNWVDGSGSSFKLAAGSYPANRILVRQTDLAGNSATSDAYTNPILVDQTVAKPVFVLKNDTGSSNSDGISKDGAVTVSGLEDGATWEYSTDGGQSWKVGSGTSFTLVEGAYEINVIQVRQTDKAGNVATSDGNATAIKISTSAPQIAVVNYFDNDKAQQGEFGFDIPTNDLTPTIKGTGNDLFDPAAKVELFRRNGSGVVSLGSTTLVDGKWSITPDSGLSDGVYKIFARLTNSAGISSESAEQTLTVDLSTSGTLDGFDDGTGSPDVAKPFNSPTQKTQVNFIGQAEKGSRIDIYRRTGDKLILIGTGTSDPVTGKYSILNSVALDEGVSAIFVRITDPVGNSLDTEDVKLTVSLPRASTPEAPVVLVEAPKLIVPMVFAKNLGAENRVQASFGAPLGSVFDVKTVNSVVVTADGQAFPRDVTGSTARDTGIQQVPAVEYATYLRPAFVEVGILVRERGAGFVQARADLPQIDSVKVTSRPEVAPYIEDTRTGRILVRRDGPAEVRMEVEITLQDGTVMRQQIRVDTKSGQFTINAPEGAWRLPHSLDQQLAALLWGDVSELADLFAGELG